MSKENYLKLTLAVYRVTQRFPKKEPLKFQIREKVNEVLCGLILTNPSPSPSVEKKLSKDLEILENYFQIADEQNWIDSRNFLFLEKEYGKIRKDFSGLRLTGHCLTGLSNSQPVGRVESDFQQSQRKNDFKKVDVLLPRHKRILEILNKQGRAQVHEFKKIFPQVSKRTLRRDFEFLLSQQIIKRKGEKNNTFYKLVV